MSIAYRLSNSLSNFRFSLNPTASNLSNQATEQRPASLSVCHSVSESTPRTKSLDDTLDGSEKEHKISVVEADPTTSTKDAALSPITPWDASFHRNAASTAQETTYLTQSRYLRTVRAVISLLLLSLGATTVALNADILHHYNATHVPSEFFLNLWPMDLNLTPTLLILICGSVVAFLSLVYTLVSTIPSPVSKSALSNGVFTGLTTLSLPLTISVFTASAVSNPASIFGTFISSAVTTLTTTTGSSHTVGLPPAANSVDAKRETIQSFTCQIADSARAFGSDATMLKLSSVSSASDLVPTGFARLCTESRVSYGLMVGMLALEVAALVVVVASIVIERKINNMRLQREVASRDGEIVPESLVGEKMEA